MKKVTMGTRPTTQQAADTAEAWVKNRNAGERMKRLTIDIPADLHRRIKTACAARETKIVDEIRELLLKKYGTQ